MESVKQKINEADLELEVLPVYNEIINKPEIIEALNLLDSLPKNLFYHNKNHTLDVIKETILFAIADNANLETIETQAIAAAWHDVGHTKRSKDHESIGVEIFKESEAYKNMSKRQRDEIVASIIDTQIIIKNGKPSFNKKRNTYGYVLDADVSNFGRKDYFEKGELVAKEAGLDLSDNETKKKFLNFAVELLKNHEWKTNSAKILRQEQKEINLQQSEKILGQL